MLTWSAFSAPGTRYGSLNQDSYLCVAKSPTGEKKPAQKDSREGQVIEHSHNSKGEEAFLFAVFDGHSILGEEASNCAKHSFEKSFERFKLSSSKELEKGFFSMFQQAHEDILKIYENPPERAHYVKHGRDKSFVLAENKALYQAGDEDIKPIEFGCTAASVIVLPDEIWIGWVGDSRVLICYEDSKHSGNLSCFYATVDHNTKNEHEVSRLEEEQIEADLRPDGYVEIHTEYGIVQNLAMTRALGHVKFAEKGGVISTPELRKMKRKAIKYIIIMSDGVCNILKKAELLEICKSAGAKEASKIIVTRAIEKASEIGKSAADNSTAVVVHFQ